MIVGVISAEQKERQRRKDIKSAVVGYDMDKEAIVTCKLPRQEVEAEAQKLEMMPNTKGKHKYAKCQDFYESIHTFMENRMWTATKEEVQCGGTTWLELFILYDTQGYRRTQDDHIVARQDHARAKRRSKKRAAKGSTCVARLSLKSELKMFKNMVRYIALNDLRPEQQELFKCEKKDKH